MMSMASYTKADARSELRLDKLLENHTAALRTRADVWHKDWQIRRNERHPECQSETDENQRPTEHDQDTTMSTHQAAPTDHREGGPQPSPAYSKTLVYTALTYICRMHI